ncbi:MAG: peptide-methionine (S)-S-oxide reductase [Candidatus Yanofskybacteria bacterium RIFCSPHIGHO2_01_FULL_44_17]|uniref:Peptide methionine sulfoxide reductase MsrA n=1 Tax=Candidatus Yanofskybacteria bacterium RIFCSPHIGHO2_01_FULL_44_17 TaxID=1802668 RepID=A0A1F8EW50_9BACT|nr:MAG: peptide-methionine (S)-S-oxide reductase [Candidatus Yanofskybacteria bacterium RIFCSPHIGHO2_01_FULL_44_17]
MVLQKNETAIFGGGCFWCTEAVFVELRGVISVMPGYAGGTMPGPIYEQVCGGNTGHAEVSKIEFEPSQISYDDLLTVFFATHDPTTLNRQGNDVGTQYRSIILYTSSEQKSQAEAFISELNKEGQKVVTELKPLEKFYPAEEYHREYFKKNPDKAYCQLVISPKLEKLREKFNKLLKAVN